MALFMARCPVCDDEHTLRFDLTLDVHHNQAGDRCAGSPTLVAAPAVPSGQRFPSQKNRVPQNRSRDGQLIAAPTPRGTRGSLKAQAPKDRVSTEQQRRDVAAEPDELGEAFDFVAFNRETLSARVRSKSSTITDRNIYVVHGVRMVSGGLPSHGKRY